MAQYQILYWQDIPSQVKAWDDFDEIKLELPIRFTERIDETSEKKGLTSADDYMAQLKWGDEQERAGEAAEVAEAVRKELKELFP